MDIREITSYEDVLGIKQLEQAIWQGADNLSESLLLVFVRHGGIILGAYHDNRLVGFLVAFPAVMEGGLYLHSHMLGVLPEFRQQGIARKLKQSQWQWAQKNGYSLVGWTFDPLQSANAWFNLRVIGARVHHFIPNAYGESSDALNAGMPTDRFFVVYDGNGPLPIPAGTPRLLAIPQDISRMRHTDRDTAQEHGESIRQAVQEWWPRGWRITGIVQNDQGLFYEWHRME